MFNTWTYLLHDQAAAAEALKAEERGTSQEAGVQEVDANLKLKHEETQDGRTASGSTGPEVCLKLLEFD